MPKQKINVQNIQLEKDNLLAKYGDVKVGVVKLIPEIKAAILGRAFLPYDACHVLMDHGGITIRSPLSIFIAKNIEYMCRRDAELDETYLQPINYAVLTNGTRDDQKYYLTKRLGGGDQRLTGLYSLGIGGHVDHGEVPMESFYRELEEEVGVFFDDMLSIQKIGYIYDTSTAIGRVHVGIVSLVDLNREDIQTKEPDKLSGEWASEKQVLELHRNGALESWSSLVVNALIKGGRFQVDS